MAPLRRNLSFDGSPVAFQLDSPLLAYCGPLALDRIRDLSPADTPLEVGGLLERINADFPAMGCYTIHDFRPGMYTLDPRDLQKFGDEDEDAKPFAGQTFLRRCGPCPVPGRSCWHWRPS